MGDDRRTARAPRQSSLTHRRAQGHEINQETDYRGDGAAAQPAGIGGQPVVGDGDGARGADGRLLRDGGADGAGGVVAQKSAGTLSKEELEQIKKHSEAESNKLKEDLARAQDALLQIQQSKHDAERQHEEQMAKMQARIDSIQTNNEERVGTLENELEHRSEVISELSDEVQTMRTTLEGLIHAKQESDDRTTTWSEYNLLNKRLSALNAQAEEMFGTAINFEGQRALMLRVVEQGRQHLEASQVTEA